MRPEPPGLPPQALGLVALTAALVGLVYAPAAFFPLLDWDDLANLVRNTAYQGFDLEMLRWIFTTHHFGPYQPLSWLSWTLDHALWGLDERAFHSTNIVLHGLNAVFYLLAAYALLRRARPAARERGVLLLAAWAAAAFALHPLRVESVAWVTERRDVLSGFFFLLSLIAYLEAHPAGLPARPGVLSASWFLAVLAFLSKGTAVGLCWALMAVDVWALGRLPLDPRRWGAPAARGALLEKLPFFAAAAAAGAMNLWGFRTGDLHSAGHGPLERLAMAAHGASFYLEKTLWPSGLSPYYPLPRDFDALAGPLAARAAAVGLVTAVLWGLRRRAPGGLTAWLCYLLMLAPVSGLLQSGRQLAADRYTYLACLPFPLLAAGALGAWLGVFGPSPLGRSWMKRAAGAAAAVLVLGLLAWRSSVQLAYWKDDEALWRRALSLAPDNFVANHNLAVHLLRLGDRDGALDHFRAAAAVQPDDFHTLLNLGALEGERGELEAGRRALEAALLLKPGHAEALNNMAGLLLRRGDREGAKRLLAEALARDPNLAQARANLALLLKGRKTR